MAESIYDNAKLYFDGYDVSGDVNSLAMALDLEKGDATAMGANTRKNLAGLKSINFSLSGMVDETVTGVIPDSLQIGDKAVSICPDSSADGALAYPVKGFMGGYNPGGAVGDVAVFSAEGLGVEYGRGKVLKNGTITASGDGSVALVSEASGAVTFVGCLHVTALSGSAAPSLTVSVYSDSSADFLTPTLIGTFDAITAIGGKTLVVAGAFTEKYLRASWTITGTNPSFTAVITGGFAKS